MAMHLLPGTLSAGSSLVTYLAGIILLVRPGQTLTTSDRFILSHTQFSGILALIRMCPLLTTSTLKKCACMQRAPLTLLKFGKKIRKKRL
jgi:hypothetical protein